jgi:D-sedoheptulose 7-phosphate isomerase
MVDIKDIARKYLDELKETIDLVDLEDVQKVASVLLKAYRNNRRVFILGNGGAASTASHMACDLGKGTLKNVYNPEEKRFQVISLTDNVATMTAYANDLSFDDMFVQQLHNLVAKDDVVIGISGSGNTPNIIKALMYAKSQGATTVGFLGFKSGGKARDLVDYDITIQSSNYGVIEDLQLALDHILTTCLSYMKEHVDNLSQVTRKKKDQGRSKTTPDSDSSHIASEWTERSARR